MLARLIAIALFLVATPSVGAEIFVRNDGWIVVRGPMVSADGDLFRRVAGSKKQGTTVVFESNGGSAGAAIAIGEEIKRNKFATLVEAGKTCASACGFAWLAGNPRIIDPAARLGFHGVYVMDGDRPVVSGSANAVMGSYLGALGLPPSAIFYVTDAKPEGMNWITPAVAKSLGLDLWVLDRPETRSRGKPNSEELLQELFGGATAE